MGASQTQAAPQSPPCPRRTQEPSVLPEPCSAPSTNTASVILCYPCSRNVSPAPAHPALGQGCAVPHAARSRSPALMLELRHSVLAQGPPPCPTWDGGFGLTPSAGLRLLGASHQHRTRGRCGARDGGTGLSPPHTGVLYEAADPLLTLG